MNLLIKINTLTLALLFQIASGFSQDKIRVNNEKNQEDQRLYKIDEFYFISGDPDVKLNFTFAYQLSTTYKIDLVYNQTMFWNLKEESSPFKDINFNPKLIKRMELDFLNLDIGVYEHHSNGKDGANSRSYDSFFLNFRKTFITSFSDISVNTTLKYYYRIGDENKNISEIKGNAHFFLRMSFPLSDDKKRSLDLSLSFSPGGKYNDLFKYGYQEINILYNPGIESFPVKIQGQIYRGYTESLIDFNKKNTSYRIGISI